MCGEYRPISSLIISLIFKLPHEEEKERKKIRQTRRMFKIHSQAIKCDSMDFSPSFFLILFFCVCSQFFRSALVLASRFLESHTRLLFSQEALDLPTKSWVSLGGDSFSKVFPVRIRT